MPVESLYAANDPNPDPPPLVEEIREFQAHCCMRLTLWQAQVQRSMHGPPECKVSVNMESANPFNVKATASFESQGFRPYMEDRVVNSSIVEGKAGLYAILDGHGLEGEGHLVAESAAASLSRVFNKHMSDQGLRSTSTSGSSTPSGTDLDETNGAAESKNTADNDDPLGSPSSASASPSAVACGKIKSDNTSAVDPAPVADASTDLGPSSATLLSSPSTSSIADFKSENIAPPSSNNNNNNTSSVKGSGLLGTSSASSSSKSLIDKEHLYKERIDRAVIEIDTHIRRVLPSYADDNGSTLVAAVVEAELITFANVGDSRGILINDDYSLEFVTLDHKPTVPAEEIRVQMAGGFVADMRVNGDLAVSRTLGDTSYKPVSAPRRLCAISNEPDVTCIRRQPRHRCIILASDGIWDALSSADVADIMHRYRVLDNADESTFKQRCHESFTTIVKEASCARLSSDNLSLLLIILDKKSGSADTSTAVPPSSTSSSSSKSVPRLNTVSAAPHVENEQTVDKPASNANSDNMGSRLDDKTDHRNVEVELT